MPQSFVPADRYLAHVLYAVQFDRDSQIRLKQGEFERAFGGLFTGKQSVNTNAPDEASPSSPRFIYSTSHVQLTLSQNALQLSMRFDRTGPPFSEQLRIAKRKVDDLERSTKQFLAGRAHRDSGVILTVDYPTQTSVTDLSQYLFDRFLKFKPLGTPASTAFTVGFRSERSFYENVNVSIYEIREGPAAAAVRLPAMLQINLDIESMRASEHGIEYKIDVNDKPRFAPDSNIAQRDPALLWQAAVDLADAHAAEILGY
jgi:hypothetical protein